MSNKNIIITALSVLVFILTITLVVISNKEIKEKIVLKTIVEEKIVYITEEKEIVKFIKAPKKKEVKKEIDLQEAVEYDLPEVEVPVTKDKQYILSQTRDNKGRFSIALLSSTKPPKKAFYDRKIILHSEIEDGEYLGKFLFLVPPFAVENISDISIKITDAISGDSFTQTAYCIDGIEDTYTYSMNISFSDGFTCYTQEKGEAFKIPKQSDESIQRMKEIFEKSKIK